MFEKSILFVDDDPLLLNALQRMLRPLQKKGWGFAYADSGAQALAMLEEAQIDTIVTDMCMPQMNGLQLLDLIKKYYPDTVRVMMTGKSDYEIYQDGMSVSQFFLWKPVQFSAMETLLQLLSNEAVSLQE